MVPADGRPKEAMYECKRIFQPIQCSWADSVKGLLRILNLSQVLNVNKYTAYIVIREDGRIISEKQIGGIDVAPGTEAVFPISNWIPKMNPEAEYHADIRFVLQKATSWASSGHTIASNQLLIKQVIKSSPEVSHRAGLRITNTETEVSIKAKDFTAIVKKTGAGGLSSLIYKGKETILQPLVPHFTGLLQIMTVVDGNRSVN